MTDAAARRAVDALTAAGVATPATCCMRNRSMTSIGCIALATSTLAQLQRALIRSAAGSEIKHLNRHVDDVRAG